MSRVFDELVGEVSSSSKQSTRRTNTLTTSSVPSLYWGTVIEAISSETGTPGDLVWSWRVRLIDNTEYLISRITEHYSPNSFHGEGSAVDLFTGDFVFLPKVDDVVLVLIESTGRNTIIGVISGG